MSSSTLAPTAGTPAVPSSTNNRAVRCFTLKVQDAANDFLVPSPPQLTNGDEARYADKCGTYTKCVKQKSLGVVDPAAWTSFKTALDSGNPADFEKIQLGGTRTLNGPQGGLAFDLEGLDSSQFAVPPAPALASDAYATELVELYWASLMRDVNFTDYPTNALAAQAAAELSSLPTYAGPRESSGMVTPNVLFRGPYSGETVGPYLSQFLLQPTAFGAMNLDQRYVTLQAGTDFMLDPDEFRKVQNGVGTGKALTPGPAMYLHNGRGLASFTHVDVLYQAYLMAYLVLDSIDGTGVPLNPGNPYNKSKTQNGFNTMGQPDIAACLTAVASEALKAVWYQKWYVHLRHRPESGGGIVYLIKTGQGNTVQGTLSSVVLNSKAVQTSFSKYNSYLLSQAFPEGSPAHPAYPTGHGTVAGACITALKFFFDGNYAIKNPVISTDGNSLVKYTGPGASQMTVNGELHKLAHNISFGHGIHAGIHWRSDTDTSIQLGEAVALRVLQDRASTYNEKFSINITKTDGTTATISNM